MPPAALIGLLSLVLLVSMVLLGAQVRLEYLTAVLHRPRALLAGLAGQLVLLPLLAAVFFVVYPAPASVKASIFIVAAGPGGAISNMVTYWGGGRLALSVVLTACSTLAGVVTIPLWVNVGLRLTGGETADGLSVGPLALRSFATLAVPLGLGFAVGAWKPVLAERLSRPTRRLMPIMVFVVMGLYVAYRWTHIVEQFTVIVVAGAAMFNVVAVLGASNAARGLGLDRRDSFTIGVEAGIQNSVIGLLIVELTGRIELLPFVGYYAVVSVLLVALWVPLLSPERHDRWPAARVQRDRA